MALTHICLVHIIKMNNKHTSARNYISEEICEYVKQSVASNSYLSHGMMLTSKIFYHTFARIYLASAYAVQPCDHVQINSHTIMRLKQHHTIIMHLKYHLLSQFSSVCLRKEKMKYGKDSCLKLLMHMHILSSTIVNNPFFWLLQFS